MRTVITFWVTPKWISPVETVLVETGKSEGGRTRKVIKKVYVDDGDSTRQV